jgi:glutathione S-transferase
MKLIFTPNPGYAHKVLVVAHEAGVLDRLEFERCVPFDEDTTVWNYNPFGKVPCLVLDDGEPLFGGLVICEYLDSLRVTGPSLYPTGARRWPALRQMVLGDGLFDATTLMRVEGWRKPEERHLDYMLRERRKILNAIDRMEFEVPAFLREAFHIGHICMAGGLSYLELRNPVREHALAEGDAQFDWRASHPRLAAWYDSVQTRPSIEYRIAAADPAARIANQKPR